MSQAASNVVEFSRPTDRESREPWSDSEIIDLDDYFHKTLEELADEPNSRIGDAEIWGVMSDEVADLPIVLSTAKNREAREWTTQKEARFIDVFKGIFSKHVVGKKDGNSIVTGSLGQSSKRRTKNNVLANYMMGLDVDSGASMDDTFQKVRRANLTAIFYTTHSHGTTEVEIAYDKFHRWCVKEELPAEPTTEMVRRYMRDQTNYVTDVCDSAEFIEKRHEDGMKLIVRTRPIDKFRIIFPLAQPYVYAQQVGAHKDVIQLWESKALGMGRSLGIEIDRVARDPSRLFYLPRHGKDSTNHRIMLNCGRLLSFEDIPTASMSSRVTDDPFDQAAAILGGTNRGRLMTPTLGLDLGQWAKDHAHHFDIASLFRDHCEERIRETQTVDKLTTDCPYDEDHSNPGDPEDKGTFIQSAGMDAEAFAFHCSHAGCAGRSRLDHLQKAMQDGWFPDDALIDKGYFTDDEDEEVSTEDGDLEQDLRAAAVGSKPARARVFAEAKTAAALLTEDSPDEDVEAVQRLAAVLRETESERVVKIMKDKTGLALAKLRKGIDALRDSESEAKSPYHFATLEAGIKALNKEIAMVERGTDVMIVQKREEDDGWKSIRAARTVFAPWKVGKGEDMTPLFPLWEESHLRDYRTEVVFNPYRHGDADPTPLEHYNLYKGLAVDPLAGDWMSLQRHLFHVVCNGDTRLFRFMMGWAADLFQNPTMKPGTALVLHGLKGTGKTLPFVPLQQILGLRHSVKVNNRKHLTGNFNEHMAGKLLVVAEESFWGGDKEADSSLKDQITSDTVLLEKKFADAVPVRDYRRFIILSNASSVVRATPDERRYAATTVSDARIGDTEYFDALVADIYGGKIAPAMLHDLLNLDISDIDLRRPPKTAALVGQIINALPADERWIRGVLLSGSFTGVDGADLLDERTSEKWLTEPIKVTKEIVRESYRSAVKAYGGGQVDPGEIGTFFLSKFKGTEAEIDDTRSGRGKREYVLPPLPEMIAAYERNWTPLDPDTTEDERDFIRAADKNDPDECRRVEKDADDFINAFFKR